MNLMSVTVEYLEEAFPKCEIVSKDEQDAPGDLCLEVYWESNRYYLRVQKEVMDNQTSDQDYYTLLENYQVAGTMKGLGDFPVVVTEYGCIFGSP